MEHEAQGEDKHGVQAADGIKALSGAPRASVVRTASAQSTATTNGGQRPHSRTRRRNRTKHVDGSDAALRGWTFMLHLSLALALVAIAAVWVVTPLSWAYVLWTALTQIPALRKGQPAPPSGPFAFRVLHYLTLAYTASECLFSLYYRYLAYRCQALRPPLRHSRKHLRTLFLRALENGTAIEDEEESDEHQRHLVRHCSDEAPVDRAGSISRRARRYGRTEEDQARDEEEAARGSDDGEIKVPPAARRRPPRASGGDSGGLTPELSTAELPSDYMSARQIPVLRRDAAQGGDLDETASVVSRMSMRSLDSAMPASPRSTSRRSLRLPHKTDSVAPAATDTAGPVMSPLPHSRFLPRLSPTDPRAHDFREYVRHWFGGCEFKDIKRDNMADWLAWSMYGSPLHELERERKEWDRAGRPALYCADGVTLDTDPEIDHDDGETEEGAELDDAALEKRRHRSTFDGDKLGFIHFCLTLCEARAAAHFEPGRNPHVKALRLTLDPVRVTSRPLLLYGVVALLQNTVIARAKTRGFRQFDDGDATKYLLRIPEGWEPRPDLPEEERPLIFLHGLGMGMSQYTTLVGVLGKSRSLRRRPILILLQPHISMSFFVKGFLDPPDQKRCTTGLARALRMHRMDERAGGCTVLSHSNGTVSLACSRLDALTALLTGTPGADRSRLAPEGLSGAHLAQLPRRPRLLHALRAVGVLARSVQQARSPDRIPHAVSTAAHPRTTTPTDPAPGPTGTLSCASSESPTCSLARSSGPRTSSSRARCPTALRHTRPPSSSPRTTPSSTPSACALTCAGAGSAKCASRRRSGRKPAAAGSRSLRACGTARA